MRLALACVIVLLAAGSASGEDATPAGRTADALRKHRELDAALKKHRLRVRLALEEGDFDAWAKSSAGLQEAITETSSAAENLALRVCDCDVASAEFRRHLASGGRRTADEFSRAVACAQLVGDYERQRVVLRVAHARALAAKEAVSPAAAVNDLKGNEDYMEVLGEERAK